MSKKQGGHHVTCGRTQVTLGTGDAVWTTLPVTGRVPGAPCILDLSGRAPIESRIPVDPSGPVDACGCVPPRAADADTGTADACPAPATANTTAPLPRRVPPPSFRGFLTGHNRASNPEHPQPSSVWGQSGTASGTVAAQSDGRLNNSSTVRRDCLLKTLYAARICCFLSRPGHTCENSAGTGTLLRRRLCCGVV